MAALPSVQVKMKAKSMGCIVGLSCIELVMLRLVKQLVLLLRVYDCVDERLLQTQ